MGNFYEIAFTKEELEILQIVLTPDLDTSFAISLYAKKNGNDALKTLNLFRSLYSRISNIIDTINTK